MTRDKAEFILEQIEAKLRGEDAYLLEARRYLREEIGEIAPQEAAEKMNRGCTNHLHAEMEADYEACWEALGMAGYEGEDCLCHFVKRLAKLRDERLMEHKP